MKHQTIQIDSSNGFLTVDLNTGDVIGKYVISDDPYFPEIKRIDVKEFQQYYRQKLENLAHVDILDVGYWLKDGTYEPPAQDWGDEIKNNTDMEDKHEYRYEPKKDIKVENTDLLGNLDLLISKVKTNTELVTELGDNYSKAVDLLKMAQIELNKFYLPDHQCEALHLINKFLKDKK